MNRPVQVCASILCCDFANLGNEIRKSEQAGCDMFHIDVMDGHFVPNISIGQVIVSTVRGLTQLPIEAHLMIEHPGYYIDSFIDAGADILSIHAECYGQRRGPGREFGQFPKEVETIDIEAARKDIQRIKSRGKQAFLTLNPGTPVCIQELYPEIDGVLVMSVNPGFAKQKFIPAVLPKIKSIRQNFSGHLSVDGGVNDQTAPAAVAAGANLLVTASYFFGSKDRGEVVSFLKGLGKKS